MPRWRRGWAPTACICRNATRTKPAHWRARHPRWLITAAAARRPRDGAVDAVFLSPVFPTRSHPEGASLSAVRANAIAQALTVPAYALGGVDARNAALLKGFVGLAAIGALA